MTTELRRGHNVEQVALALRVLAFYSGNVSRAAQVLTNAGHRTSARTLARWRDSHSDLYWEIRRQIEADASQATLVQALLIIDAQIGNMERGFDALEGRAKG
jgi:hypothetical protein